MCKDQKVLLDDGRIIVEFVSEDFKEEVEDVEEKKVGSLDGEDILRYQLTNGEMEVVSQVKGKVRGFLNHKLWSEEDWQLQNVNQKDIYAILCLSHKFQLSIEQPCLRMYIFKLGENILDKLPQHSEVQWNSSLLNRILQMKNFFFNQ